MTVKLQEQTKSNLGFDSTSTSVYIHDELGQRAERV